jgi:hypothetical protein
MMCVGVPKASSFGSAFYLRIPLTTLCHLASPASLSSRRGNSRRAYENAQRLKERKEASKEGRLAWVGWVNLRKEGSARLLWCPPLCQRPEVKGTSASLSPCYCL